jgi:hypothetical protein
MICGATSHVDPNAQTKGGRRKLFLGRRIQDCIWKALKISLTTTHLERCAYIELLPYAIIPPPIDTSTQYILAMQFAHVLSCLLIKAGFQHLGSALE